MGKVVGNSTTVSYGTGGQPLVTSSSGLGTTHNYGNVGLTNGGPGVTGKVDVPLGGTGKTVPTTVTNPFTKPSFAKAFVASARLAGRVGGGFVGAILVDAAIDYGIRKLRMEDGELKGDIDDESHWEGTRYSVNFSGIFSGWKGNVAAACDAWVTQYARSPNVTRATITRYFSDQLICWYEYEYLGSTISDGLYVSKETQSGTDVKDRTIGEQDIADRIAADAGWPSTSARALQGILGEPDARQLLEPAPVNIVGPATIPGQKTEKKESVKLLPGTNTEAPPGTTTKTDSGTKTTTSTEQHKIAYQGDKVSSTTVTNNITNITNNVTNVTTTEKTEETSKEDDKKPDFCEANPDSLICQKIDLDTPYGEIPKATRDISFQPDTSFGNGYCPSDKYQTIKGKNFMVVDWTQRCDAIEKWVKPIVIALSIFMAFMIVSGASRE